MSDSIEDGTAEHNAFEAEQLLNAWFIRRMMEDNWSFGLLLSGGFVLHVERIEKVIRGVDGHLWIDVLMKEHATPWVPVPNMVPLASPTAGRRRASINAAHVVAAVELADS